MGNPRIDLRSDTVTRPTAGMRAAMMSAELGDDVMGDDPTVIALQERVADLLGHEAALLMPSGTMSNQIAIHVHCRPGDEILCEVGNHIHRYEQGGAAQLSGTTVQPIAGCHGIVRLEQLVDMVHPDNPHLTRTRMVALENTHNYGGGTVYPYDELERICDWAQNQGLIRHLDGARLFNAVVASGISAAQWSSHFDSVSICMSKGLGCPIGSVLVGPRDFIRQALRSRKLFGGGMRQAGILAAAMNYALDHHIERLAEDHANAQRLADTIAALHGLELRSPEVETNLVFFHVAPALGTAAEFCARLREHGVGMMPMGKQMVRAVIHLDVSDSATLEACAILERVVEEARRGTPSAAAAASAYDG